jgi:hypothetical protein
MGTAKRASIASDRMRVSISTALTTLLQLSEECEISSTKITVETE